MNSLFEEYNLNKFEIKKPRRNEERIRLIDRLSEITGWSKKSIYFQTIKFPDSWLNDIISYCESYGSPSMRNKRLKEFIDLTKKTD
jgi:hypothetical protein